MSFAQLVIGPPGCGKSTYCDGMHQFLSAIGRKAQVVNLDPANESTSYPCALDIRSLVGVEQIMAADAEALGPNGAVLYAMEALEANFDWLVQGLRELGEDYILFDCPGQVELFTHHASLRNILFRIQKLGYRLVVLHLTDSYTLSQPSLYISTLLLSLRSMLQMDLPTLNVLTKIDNLTNYAPLPFPLSFYTEVQDLSYLVPHLEAENPRFSSKFSALNAAIIQLVEDYALVGFETLAVEDRRSMMTILQAVDRAGGYAFGSAEGAGDGVWATAMREGYRAMEIGDVQERWIDRKEEFDELERSREEDAKRDRDEKRERDLKGLQRLQDEQGVQEAVQNAGSGVENGDREVSNADDDDDEEQRALAAFRSRGGEAGVKVIRKG